MASSERTLSYWLNVIPSGSVAGTNMEATHRNRMAEVVTAECG